MQKLRSYGKKKKVEKCVRLTTPFVKYMKCKLNKEWPIKLSCTYFWGATMSTLEIYASSVVKKLSFYNYSICTHPISSVSHLTIPHFVSAYSICLLLQKDEGSTDEKDEKCQENEGHRKGYFKK